MEVSKNKYLNTVPFSLLVNWSAQYLIGSYLSYDNKYKIIKIGTLLKRNKTQINIKDNQFYKRVTIKVRNGGVFLRDIAKGQSIGTKKQFLIKKGQFLLSKIDARNGAFGVVPEDVDNAIITGNFWTFDIDYTLINPHFLALLTTTSEFIRFCENSSNGTTNRHYLQEDLFLNVKIPLPSLEEQNRIVKAYNKKIEFAIEHEEKARRLEKDIEIYLFDELGIKKKKEKILNDGLNFISFKDTSVWGVEKLLKGTKSNILESNRYPNKVLSQVTAINPTTDISHLKDKDEMSFIPMVCVSDNYGEIIELNDGVKGNSKGYTKFKNGDLIWARITPCMQNGKSAVVDNLKNGLGYGSTEYHIVREKHKDVLINYVYHLLRSHAIRKDAKSHFTGSAGQQRVPKSYLENLVIPVPPVEIQTKIISTINQMKFDIKELNIKAKENRVQAIMDFESEIFIND